ncbi:MAG: phosphatidate cytidylyltransferase, partial [Acidimicrobiia bacterium]|nr:phosphatidate cytidylyltransferase [Acidimicrobiia bacterium]
MSLNDDDQQSGDSNFGSSPAEGPDEPDATGGEVLAFPGFGAEAAGVFAAGDPSDDPDDDLEDDPDHDGADSGEIDESVDPFQSFTEEQYMASTTREYRGLAEAIERSAQENHEQQAIAAAMPGVQTGVVGFEDMTGEDTPDLHEMQAAERAERSNLLLRVGTAVGLMALLIGALLAGGAWIAALLALVIILALGEFYASVRRAGFTPVAIFGLVGSIGLLIGTWRSGPFAIGGFLVTTAVAVTLWFSLVPRRDPLGNAAITLLGVAWITGLLAFAYPIFQSADTVSLVIVLVLLTALFDVASFFVGRTFGRTQLAPVLSPNKTLEGLIGGVFLTIAAGAGIGLTDFAEPFTLQSGVALGTAVAVFAPLGD